MAQTRAEARFEMASGNFLLKKAYAPGEFERLQRQFDTAVFEFSVQLREPLERAMRATMAQDLAELLPARAAAAARFVRGEQKVAPAEATELEQLRQELAGLGTSLELDAVTVAEEVEACAGELAHHTLSLWLAALRRALRPGAGEALNANMLPGSLSMQEILHELDVDAFGVEIDTVMVALGRYRKQLRARAIQSRSLITFADDLLIAVGREDAPQPYTLYAAPADFERDAARAKRAASPPPATTTIRERMIKVAQQIDMAVSSHVAPIAQYERLIDAALGNPDCGRFKVGDVRVTLPSRAAAARTTPARSPAGGEFLGYQIEAVADVVAAQGNGINDEFKERIATAVVQLNDYCEVRQIPLSKVSTAYAVLVAARAEPTAYDSWYEGTAGSAVGGGSVENDFAQALDLSVDVSASLINDAGVGPGRDWSADAVAGSLTIR
ncbi:MAG: hypothetical protein ABI330_04950 [Caldimonas sp.]